MKISLHIPREANLDDVRSFLRNEIGQARNIKRKQVRKSVMSGLAKLVGAVDGGVSLFTDGDELIVESYDGI